MKKKPSNVPETGFWFDEPSHSYYMDGKPMTGCTTILGVLNKPALVGWAAKMAVEYIKENTLRTGSLEDMKYENGQFVPEGVKLGDYIVSEKLLEEAKTAYAKKRDDAASKGTDTHALVEDYINQCLIGNGYADERIEHSAQIRPFVMWAIKENIRFIASEKQLYSKSLFIAGTADLIFEKDGKRYLGDIKTYKKIWDRVPFYQCAGYALMWEEMKTDEIGLFVKGESNTLESPYIDGYCIINLPKEREFNEAEDVMWSWDTEGDTKAFKACVEIYRQNATFADYKVIKQANK